MYVMLTMYFVWIPKASPVASSQMSQMWTQIVHLGVGLLLLLEDMFAIHKRLLSYPPGSLKSRGCRGFMAYSCKRSHPKSTVSKLSARAPWRMQCRLRPACVRPRRFYIPQRRQDIRLSIMPGLNHGNIIQFRIVGKLFLLANFKIKITMFTSRWRLHKHRREFTFDKNVVLTLWRFVTLIPWGFCEDLKF